MAWELTERRARRFHIGHGGLSATSDRLETFEIFLRGEVWTLSESRAPFRDSRGLSCATSEVRLLRAISVAESKGFSLYPISLSISLNCWEKNLH